MVRMLMVILMLGTLVSLSACGKRGAPIRPSEVPAAESQFTGTSV